MHFDKYYIYFTRSLTMYSFYDKCGRRTAESPDGKRLTSPMDTNAQWCRKCAAYILATFIVISNRIEYLPTIEV